MRERVNFWIAFPLVLGRYPVPVLHPRRGLDALAGPGAAAHNAAIARQW